MVIITKENKKNYGAGTFVVLGLDNQPVLKNNGQPWSGKTNSMSNYYGVIVGAGKYNAVKTSAIWKPEYTISFIPQEDQIPGENKEEEVVVQDHKEKHEGELIKMQEYDFDFTYQNKSLPAHVLVELFEDDDLFITCKLGENEDQWKKVWFKDVEDWKKSLQIMPRIEDLHNALEDKILQVVGEDFEYDKDAISWSNLLTEGDFMLKALR